MKKLAIVCLLLSMLCGCADQETFETMEDEVEILPAAAVQQFVFQIPEGAASPTMQNDGGELYLCGDCTISKQIMDSGDLEKTVKTLCGKDPQDLEILQTSGETYDRYDFVWAAAGEEGLQLGRACILDDGNYHYALTAMAGEETAGELREDWQTMFDSCRLIDPEVNLRTGS